MSVSLDRGRLLCFVCVVLTCCVLTGEGIYVNTGEPTVFCSEETNKCKSEIGVLSNPMSSSRSALTFMPQRLNLCLFNDSTVVRESSYDRMIAGDRLTHTALKMDFGEAVKEKQICNHTTNGTEVEFLKEAIKQQFKLHLLVDDVPVMWCYQARCTESFPIGCYIDQDGRYRGWCLTHSMFSGLYAEPNVYFIYNHFSFTVYYEPVTLHGTDTHSSAKPSRAGKIVYVTVDPDSLRTEKAGISRSDPMVIKDKWLLREPISIPFTYDVIWKETEKHRWSERWSLLENRQNNQVLFFSVINSGISAIFIFLLLIMLLMRTHPRFLKLHLRLKAWNKKMTLCTSWHLDEDGWKQLDMDVFRPPRGVLMLAALSGNGAQLFFTAFSVSVAGCAGLLVRANPGMLVKISTWSYGFSGLAAGCTSCLVYRCLRGNSKQEVAWNTLFSIYCRSWLISGVLLSVWLVLNLLHSCAGSSSALGVGAVGVLLVRLACLPVPCCLLGGALACRLLAASPATRRALAPCDSEGDSPLPVIPRQPCYLSAWVRCLIEGILPFSVLFITTVLCLKRVWNGVYVEMGGFYLAVLFFMITSGAAICCYMTFLQLCKHNYHWWWRSFLGGAGLAGMHFSYLSFFYARDLQWTGAVSVSLFFGYAFLTSAVLFLLVGPLSFMGTYVFLCRQFYHLQLERQQGGGDKGVVGGGGQEGPDDKAHLRCVSDGK